jgi:hypothetical protein
MAVVFGEYSDARAEESAAYDRDQCYAVDQDFKAQDAGEPWRP